jgi:methyl-accepting chemotaxis protein
MTASEGRSRLGMIPAFWRVRDWRMGFKLLIAFLFVAILSVALTGFLGIRSSRDALLAQGVNYLMTRSNSTSSVIDQYLVMHREDLVAEGRLTSLVAFATNPNDATAKANALKELKSLANRQNYDYESIAIANPGGNIILSSNDQEIGTNVKERSDFQAALTGSPSISDVGISTASFQPAIFFSVPIQEAGGKILAVLRGNLTLNGIRDWVYKDKDAAGPGTFSMLLSDAGVRISVSADMQTPEEIAAVMIKPETRTFEFSAENSAVRYYAAISTLKIKPWRYVIMTPISTFTSAADNLLGQFLLIALIAGGIAIILAIFLARTLTNPIVHLTKVADRISLGELDMEIGLDRKDEIGELAEALSRMQASLQATMERLRARRTGT